MSPPGALGPRGTVEEPAGSSTSVGGLSACRDPSSFRTTVAYVATFPYVILVARAMCPFSVTLEHVPDRDLGPLLAQLSEAGFATPIIRHAGADGPSEEPSAPVRAGVAGPARRLAPPATSGRASRIGGRNGATPTRPTACSWARRAPRAPCRSGSVRRSARTPGAGTASTSSRSSAAARRSIRSSSSSPPTTSRTRASSSRSSAAATEGAACTGSATSCPRSYAERFRTQIYNERVAHPGAWNKLVVVAREDDDHTMLNHALIQSRRRYRT